MSYMEIYDEIFEALKNGGEGYMVLGKMPQKEDEEVMLLWQKKGEIKRVSVLKSFFEEAEEFRKFEEEVKEN